MYTGTGDGRWAPEEGLYGNGIIGVKQDPTTKALWTSTYRLDMGWTAAKPILEGAATWSKSFVDSYSADGQTSAFALPEDGQDQAPLGGLRYLSLTGHEWASSRIPATESAVEASSAVLEGRRLVLFVGVDASLTRDANSVLAVESLDGGNSWSGPKVIAHSDGLPAQQPRLRDTLDGLLALWIQSSASGGHVIRTARLGRGLTVGVGAPPLEIGGPIAGLQVIVDACDRVHVVFERYEIRTANGSLVHAMLWDGAWSEPAPLFTDLRAIDAALSLTPRGVELEFLAQPASAPPRTAYASFKSHLDVKC